MTHNFTTSCSNASASSFSQSHPTRHQWNWTSSFSRMCCVTSHTKFGDSWGCKCFRSSVPLQPSLEMYFHWCVLGHLYQLNSPTLLLFLLSCHHHPVDLAGTTAAHLWVDGQTSSASLIELLGYTPLHIVEHLALVSWLRSADLCLHSGSLNTSPSATSPGLHFQCFDKK